MIAAELCQELEKVNFVSLTICVEQKRAGTPESGDIGPLTFHNGDNWSGGAFL